ncbi:MAG: LysR family transcriptional regulator [Pseudomonadota bacterium]
MDLKQAEIGLLIALDVLLETESVTQAARRLGISQPAMSAQLTRLRKMFNDPLLVASGRRLMPTARAAQLREPLRHLLSDLDAIVREHTHFNPVLSDRTFHLIGTDYVHAVLGAPLIAELAKDAPKARLAMLPFDPPAVWRTLEGDQADAALVTGMNFPDARVRDGLDEDFVAIQRKRHPRGSRKLTLKMFCDAEHILVSPEGGGFTGAADKALNELDRSRRVAYSIPSFLLAPSLVAQSNLLCLLPRRLAVLHSHSVDSYELPFPSPRFKVQLIWHPRRHNDPAHVWFRALLVKVLKNA